MDAQTILIRLALIGTGFLLIYLSARDILDPMVLMPMGLAMVLVNGATLTIEGKLANLFVDPMLADPEKVVNSMQIFFLQPIYNLMFSNGLIACLVFMGIGVMVREADLPRYQRFLDEVMLTGSTFSSARRECSHSITTASSFGGRTWATA